MAKYIIIILSIAVISIVSGATRVYDIEPYRNCNGWSPQGPPTTAYIGQTFIATCDSFVWVDFFVGASNQGNPYRYVAEIFEHPGGVSPVFRGDTWAGQGYEYVRIQLRRFTQNRIVKGQTYLLKITHSDGDSINFYYDPNDPYPQYGEIQVGGGRMYPPPQNQSLCDLAARIEGVNKNSC